MNYHMRESDVTCDLGSNTTTLHNTRAEPWRVTLVDTGAQTMTGGRLRRVREHLRGESAFCMTYGDGVADVDIGAAIAIDVIEDDATVWENSPLETLVDRDELSVYRHDGFWQPMDTLRDRNHLETLWSSIARRGACGSNSMRILITGNMGYIGPVVAAHLRQRYPQAWLVGLDRGWFAHCLSDPRRLPEVVLDQQWFGDVRDLTAQQLQGFDAVVHLAAISNDAMGKRFELVTDAINCKASVAVAHAAAQAGVRHFVFASSCSVYGAAADGTPRSETSAIAPLTAYAHSRSIPNVRLRSWMPTW